MIHTEHIKAIVVDLDRTLLHTDLSLSAYTLNVLHACKKQGIKIMVATARPFRAAKQYTDLICPDAMVASNGARILYQNQQTDHGICPQSARRLLTALSRYPDLRITLDTGDHAYSNHPIEDYEMILSDNLADISTTEGALKILVHLDREETLALVEKELTEDLYVTIAHGRLLQIMSTAATKWRGIQTLLDLCSCSPDETVYFGDDQDDIEPIKMCGLGVAVSNGIDAAKEAADEIAEANDADGVARYIEQRIWKNS